MTNFLKADVITHAGLNYLAILNTTSAWAHPHQLKSKCWWMAWHLTSEMFCQVILNAFWGTKAICIHWKLHLRTETRLSYPTSIKHACRKGSLSGKTIFPKLDMPMLGYNLSTLAMEGEIGELKVIICYTESFQDSLGYMIPCFKRQQQK